MPKGFAIDKAQFGFRASSFFRHSSFVLRHCRWEGPCSSPRRRGSMRTNVGPWCARPTRSVTINNIGIIATILKLENRSCVARGACQERQTNPPESPLGRGGLRGAGRGTRPACCFAWVWRSTPQEAHGCTAGGVWAPLADAGGSAGVRGGELTGDEASAPAAGVCSSDSFLPGASRAAG